MVHWLPVPGFPGYEVSDAGDVRRAGRILRPWRVEGSRDAHRVYLKVGLCRDGKRFPWFVHRLVCLAFHGEPPADARDVCHRNHDSTDNRASNLQWLTHAENIRDTYSDHAVERRAIFEEGLGVLFYPGPCAGLPF